MEKIVNVVKPFCCPIYIHRNLYPGEKDFGVSMDKIREAVIKM